MWAASWAAARLRSREVRRVSRQRCALMTRLESWARTLFRCDEDDDGICDTQIFSRDALDVVLGHRQIPLKVRVHGSRAAEEHVRALNRLGYGQRMLASDDLPGTAGVSRPGELLARDSIRPDVRDLLRNQLVERIRGDAPVRDGDRGKPAPFAMLAHPDPR